MFQVETPSKFLMCKHWIWITNCTYPLWTAVLHWDVNIKSQNNTEPHQLDGKFLMYPRTYSIHICVGFNYLIEIKKNYVDIITAPNGIVINIVRYVVDNKVSSYCRANKSQCDLERYPWFRYLLFYISTVWMRRRWIRVTLSVCLPQFTQL